jgi:hypothetical protein
MKIIKPIAITPAMVTTNAPELYAAWNSATSYSKGNKVVYEYKVYESLVNTNLNKIPSLNPLDWLLVGPSNCCAAFDTSYSTSTTATNNLLFEIESTTLINSLALLNIDAPSKTLEIRMYDSSNTLVYFRAPNLDGTVVLDYYDYFFSAFEPVQDIVLTDLPPYGTYRLEIEIDGTGPISIGAIILGNSEVIGMTQYGVSFGIKDYSVKEENEFGDIVFTERNYAKRSEPLVEVYNQDLRKVARFLTSIRATPTVFIPTDTDKYDALITFGFLADWNIDITYPEHSLLRLEIKGLT